MKYWSLAAAVVLSVALVVSALLVRSAILTLAMTLQRGPVPASLSPSSSSPGDPYAVGVKPDIGPRMHQIGRPALWQSQEIALGQSGFVARAGSGVYQDEGNSDPDYYSIDVEKAGQDASYVWFQRDFAIADVPGKLLKSQIAEFVSYDDRSRVVTFQIGSRQERYRLPGP